MNLWQVWLTPSETRNRSLSPVGTETVSVVADSNGDRVGSHLVADLSRGLNNSLDNRVVSHSTNGSKGSRGNQGGVGVWEGTKNHSRVSLSVPLDNSMGKGKSVTKTMVAKTGITQSGSGNNRGGMMDHREDRGVVDQGGGCAEDGGTSSNDGRISIPLDNGMGKGKSVAKTMVAKTGITQSGNSGSGNNRGGMMDHREDRGVVDQGGGCAEDGGTSSNDGRISLPLAVVVAKAIAVVANSDGDSVGSHLMADLSRGHLDGLDDRVAGNSANRGKAVGCRCSNHWGSGVWKGCMPCKEQLRVGLRGGRSRSNDC